MNIWKQRPNTLACVRLVALGALLSACAAGSADGTNPAVTRSDGSDELVADSTQLWMPSGSDSQTNIKLCWDRSAFATGAKAQKFADARAAAVNAIQSTWDAYSWVNVTWSDTCSTGMVKIQVEDTTSAPHAGPGGGVFNFTFANWSPSCGNSDALRLSCIGSIAVHEFGHILAFPHEQNRTNGLGIVCTDGTSQPKDPGVYNITEDWDVTGIDTESIMSYCPEGEWTDMLSQTDIEGLRAVYGGDENPILPNSKAAIRNSDKTYWDGSNGMSLHMAVASIARQSSGGDGLAYGETISVEMAGQFLCGRAGTSSEVVWNTTFDAASCSWTVARPSAATGDDTLDVNDPFDLELTLPADGSNETAFEKKFSGLRMLRVL